MDFVRYADSVRAKLHMGGVRLPVVIGITAVAICVLVAGGVGLASVVAPDSAFTVEKADASDGESGQADPVQSESASLFVHVGGSVADPGLYELAGDVRVQQAIDAAGGFAEDAAIDALNLARQVQDGGTDHRSQHAASYRLWGACCGGFRCVCAVFGWCFRTWEGRHQRGNGRSAAAAQRSGSGISAAHRCG